MTRWCRHGRLCAKGGRGGGLAAGPWPGGLRAGAGLTDRKAASRLLEIMSSRRRMAPARAVSRGALLRQANDYLQKHKLLPLFEMLGQKMVSEMPADPKHAVALALAE